MKTHESKAYKVGAIAQKYNLSLTGSHPKVMVMDAKPVNVKKLVALSKTLYNDYDSNQRCQYQLMGRDRRDFFRKAILEDQNDQKNRVSKPFVVKTTTSARLKTRSKYDPNNKRDPPSTSNAIKTPAPGLRLPMVILSHQRNVSSAKTATSDTSSAVMKSHVTFDVQDYDDLLKNSDQELLMVLCEKTILDRKEVDYQNMCKIFRKIPEFDRFSDEVLLQMCIVCSISLVEKGSMIADQTSLSDNYYVIMQGNAELRKVDKPNVESLLSISSGGNEFDKLSSLLSVSSGSDSWKKTSFDRFSMGSLLSISSGLISYRRFITVTSHIKFISAGESVGTLEVKRYSKKDIVIATCTSIIFRIDANEYARIIKYVQDKRQKKIMIYLHNLSLCEAMSTEKRLILANMMTLISYPSGSTIDQQGNEIDKVRIICKGKLDVFMMLPNGKKVCLDSLEEGDYYGEELYFDKERRKSQKCLFTTIALQDCDIGYVPAAELQLLVEDKLKLSSNTSRAQDPYEIENLYHDQLDKLYWIKTRRKQIKRLIREWTGDPNIKSSWSNQYEMEKYGEKLY